MSASFRRRKTKRVRVRAAGWSLLEMLLSMSLATILLTSMFTLYYGAAKGASRTENRATANRESRFIVDRISREFKLVGLMAPQDVNGDANDITRDVPGQTWSDSLRSDFEYANMYSIVFTSDFDNDGRTETVNMYRDAGREKIVEKYWRWSRDSLRWLGPYSHDVSQSSDYLMFLYYDRDGNPVPNPPNYITGGYTLTLGERSRVTTVEVTVVTRSKTEDNGNAAYVYLPDGKYWYDKYTHLVQKFMVRCRNLSLGA